MSEPNKLEPGSESYNSHFQRTVTVNSSTSINSQTSLRSRRLSGNLLDSQLTELTNELYLSGVVEYDHIGGIVKSDSRPVHVPFSLEPANNLDIIVNAQQGQAQQKQSQVKYPLHLRHFYPRLEQLCKLMLIYASRVAKDYDFLRKTIIGAAIDEEQRYLSQKFDSEPRLKMMLEVLNVKEEADGSSNSNVVPVADVIRTDFLIGNPIPNNTNWDSTNNNIIQLSLHQVETNTISAAFSTSAGVIQKMHSRLESQESPPDPSIDVVDVIVQAHKVYVRQNVNLNNQSKQRNCQYTILFVVIEDEHLLCESLMEKKVRQKLSDDKNVNENVTVDIVSLTPEGCVTNLKLGNISESDSESALKTGQSEIESGSYQQKSNRPPLLYVNDSNSQTSIVSVIYYRAGITSQCWGYKTRITEEEPQSRILDITDPTQSPWIARWNRRKEIERSNCIKLPDAGWWLFGTKIVQSVLWKKEVLEKFGMDKECKRILAQSSISDSDLDGSTNHNYNAESHHNHDLLSSTLTPMFPIDNSTQEKRQEILKMINEEGALDKYILKKEPLGVWVGTEMVEKVKQMISVADGDNDISDSQTNKFNYRDHFLMFKIQSPTTYEDIHFVRDHQIVHSGKGIQEIGMYGTYLSIVSTSEKSDSDSESESYKCAGYLVRTKPENEPDGGVCKGIAVLDSMRW